MTTKRCTKCLQVKELECFSKHKTRRDGYQPWCKICMAEYKHKYNRSDRGKDFQHESRRRNRARYPLKWNARQALHHAVKQGYITRPDTCSICGTVDKEIHAHHDDYDNRLDVIWCCPDCHRAIHQELVEAINA